VDDTLAIAALIQAIIAKLYKLLAQNTTFRLYRRRLLDENRWRASRYGIDGRLIDFGREVEAEERSLLAELLEFVSTEVDELGTRREMQHIERIMREGTGADRQLATFARTNDIKAVVDQIVAETYEGLDVAPSGATSNPE
jgi:carboxylate-amine ligase